jgi:hypothetical protein
MTEHSSTATAGALHYLKAIRSRLEQLYDLAPGNARLREQLSDEVDWLNSQIEQGGIPAQQTQWQPIETAPKTATEVLLLVPRRGKGWPTMMRVVGHWASDTSGEEQPAFRGWFRDDGYGFVELQDAPTHWARLEPQIPERGGALPSTDRSPPDWKQDQAETSRMPRKPESSR